MPTALAISLTPVPVFSQMADMELMLLMRCASIALATSLQSSEDQMLMGTINYRCTRAA